MFLSVSFLILSTASSTFSGYINSLDGVIENLFIFSIDFCEKTSKVRIESISSSNNSIRIGLLFSRENISTIPPLMLNCPNPSIFETLS